MVILVKFNKLITIYSKMNTINRLQLRHHGNGSGYTAADGVFETRQDAIEYIYSQIRFADSGLAYEDKKYGYSLFAEPTILRYKNAEDETNPHVILAIGSYTNDGGFGYSDNRFCIIDIDNTEKEIEELWEEIEKAVKGLTIFTKNSNTLNLYSEKTEDGTIISGDVVVATSQIFDDVRKPNIILNTDDGLFTYVDMKVDEETGCILFTVNGDTKEFPINNYYIVKGYYSKKDESLHLLRKDGVDVVVSLENLIDEWGVEGEASNTPIVLTREEVGYGDDSLHNHVEPWQDVLKADVRLADRRYNILKKTSDGRYLYVDGLASNITFFKDGEEMSVQEALSNAAKGTSNDSTNIIYEKIDGYYATASLKYLNKENKLIFTTSNVTGGTSVEEIHLNSVEAFTKIYYDPVTENLVILYKDGSGDIQEVDIPIGQMMQDWEWDIQNEGHNIKLHKQRVIAGNDKVSADAAIYDDPDNILVDKNHELFVKGTADNIRYGRDGNVSDELDKLNTNDADINTRLNETSGKVDTLRVEFDAEVGRATSEEQRIEDKLNNEITRSKEKDTEHDAKISTIEQTIGDGFSIDGHETITYKFNELSAKTNTISAKTDTNDANLGLLSAKTEAEIVRAKSEEQRIEKKFDDALGEGFNIRNTVRDEFDREKAERVGEDARLQAEIEAISGNSGVNDIINLDHSIDVDKTNPSKPIVSVNLSEEIEDGKENIIKLNADGLYAGVDLEYYFESGTSKNVLVFKTTNGTKVFDLKTNSVVDKIYYDPTREAIIIEYTVDGHRMPDVVVPVHDLINEWRVSEDTNGAIKLYKFRDSGATQDVLYAESIISDHEDNILINDNGALYVSGAQIEQNKADIAALGERMDAAEADIDALEDGLAAEVARATGEEQRIDGKLDREIARSTAKDEEHDAKINELRTDITNEITNRTNEDLRLEGLIHAEEDRAKTAESAITHNLNIEIAARQSGDTLLNQKIDTEVVNREAGDANLQTQITNEVNRATSEEQRIEGKLDQEISRSTTKDDDLQRQINSEVIRATSAESVIREALTQEISDRTVGDANLQAQITSEVERAQGAENALDIKIENEKETRANEDAKIWAKIRPIEFFDTTTVHNERVRNSGETPDEVRHSVILANASENILKAKDDLGGLYAAVSIGYIESANALTIYDGIGQDRKIINTVTLGPGSLIKDISYDHAEKDLVVTYRRAGDEEDTIMKFPVADLFNEWDIQNPSEGSALELHKENQTTETGTVDILWGRVLITGAVERPDGTIDYGDNLVRIVNNGLYVSGSGITDAQETAECVKQELGIIEMAVLGKEIGKLYVCGEGYEYAPDENACFISAATNMYEADVILDNSVCSAHTRISNLEEDVECMSNELNITQDNVIGVSVPDCGLNPDGTPFAYQAPNDACFISAATNMYEADVILDQSLCEIKSKVECIEQEANSVENVLGVSGECDTVIEYPKTQGCLLSSATTFAEADAILEDAICNINVDIDGEETPTASVIVTTQSDNSKLVRANVRLSHGNDDTKWQSDSELTIVDTQTSDPTEFTDTNVLRKVEMPNELPQSEYNGIYLSNVWDCGQYTENGEGTPYEKYMIDDSATAENYYDRVYRNGKRYHNG